MVRELGTHKSDSYSSFCKACEAVDRLYLVSIVLRWIHGKANNIRANTEKNVIKNSPPTTILNMDTFLYF
jgi:hypothetical protein